MITLAGGRRGLRRRTGRTARFHTPSGVAVAPDGASTSPIPATTASGGSRRTGASRRWQAAARRACGTDAHRGAVQRANRDCGAAGRPSGKAGTAWIGRLLCRLRESPPDAPWQPPAAQLIVADTYNDAIRLVHSDGAVTTIAGGSGPGFRDGVGASAQFDTPCGIAALRDGTLLVADTGNGVVRRVTAERRGDHGALVPIDANSDVSLFRPIGIAAARNGTFYVTDRRGRILQVLPDGHARVLAGFARRLRRWRGVRRAVPQPHEPRAG